MSKCDKVFNVNIYTKILKLWYIPEKRRTSMKNTVLIVMDVQEAIVSDELFNKDEFIYNVKTLINSSRESNVEVVFIRHCGRKGTAMEEGTPGWEIYHEIIPSEGEKIFNKTYGSAFKMTGLKEYLNNKGIKSIILTGLAANYCLDTTCKVAFEYGFEVVIPEGATSTFSNEYLTAQQLCNMYEKDIWNGSLAQVLSVKQVIEKYIEA